MRKKKQREREMIITAQSKKTTTNPHEHGNITQTFDLKSFSFSLVFGSFSLSSSNGEELCDDFKWHAFSFGDFNEHKDP